MSRFFRVGSTGVLLTLMLAAPARSQNEGMGGAVAQGVNYLKGVVSSEQIGETALAALTLIKAGVPADDPAVVTAVDRINRRFAGSRYTPERTGGHDIYEAATVAMALASLESPEYQNQLQSLAGFLSGRQKPNGSWDYNHRSAGDTSIGQYALLGLWEAEAGGAKVAPQVWDRAAQWFLSVQASQGSWNYHRDEGSRWPETVSMTAAGVGSLLICKRQLDTYRKTTEVLSPLLTPLGEEGRPIEYRVSVSNAQIDKAVEAGINWLAQNYTTQSPKVGQSSYYGLYGIERVGALTGRDSLNGLDWYNAGVQYILSSGSGRWDATQHGVIPNTCWAMLFLTRATQKTVDRIEVQRLRRGTLLGGRGLPRDLSALTVAQGRVVIRPMGGAIEEMLTILEDPRAEGAESALAGLVERYYARGPEILKPYKDRFRALLDDRDPGLRQTAAWALARMGELDVAPALIATLEDPDPDVVATARFGLKLLSRQLDDFGPPAGADLDERRAAAARWRDWYESVQPPSLADQGSASDS